MVEGGSNKHDSDTEKLIDDVIIDEKEANGMEDTPGHIGDKLNEEERESEKEKEETVGLLTISTKLKVLLAGLCTSYFFYYTAFSMIAPFFPSEAEKHHVPDVAIGFIFSAYSLTAVVLSSFSGQMIPHIGARWGYIGGMFGSGLTTLSYGFLDKVDYDKTELFITLAVIIRMAEAAFCILSINSSVAIIFHQYPSSVHAKVLGMTNMFFGAGLTSGPLLGGLLYDLGGYGLPFYVVGGGILLTVPISWCVVDKKIDAEKEVVSIIQLIKQAPGILVPSFVRLVAGVVHSFSMPILALYLTYQFAVTSKTIEGMFFSLLTIGYGVGSPIWGWIGGKPGMLRAAILAGIILMAIPLFFLGPCPLLGITPTLWLLGLSLFLAGVGVAVGVIIIIDIMRKAKSSGMEDNLALGAMVAGIYYSAFFVGTAAGPITGGILYQLWGFGWTTTAVSFLCVLTTIVYSVFMGREIYLEKKQRREGYVDLEERVGNSSSGNKETHPINAPHPQYTEE